MLALPHRPIRHTVQTLIGACLAMAAGMGTARSESQPNQYEGATSARESRPLYEVGLSARIKYVPDYPAADEHRVRGVPLPHLKYRGRVFRAGEFGETFLGRIIENDLYFFSVGAKLAPAVDSNNNDARQGLEDLDILLQIGPKLGLKLTPDALDSDINLIAQARWVVSFDTSNFEVGNEGIVLNPRLQYVDYALLGPDSETFIEVGPNFTYSGLADYFYTVEPRFARSGRPAYNAREGYLGTSVEMGAEIPLTSHLKGFLGSELNYHKGSRNMNSPLYKRDFNYTVKARLTWIIYKSNRRAVR